MNRDARPRQLRSPFFYRLRVTLAAGLTLLSWLAGAPVRAQEHAPREAVAIGGGATWVAMSLRWFVTSVRVSVPVGTRVAFDGELGRNQDFTECCRVGDGASASVLARFSREGRRSDGSLRYWLVGGVYMGQRNVSLTGELIDRGPVRTMQAGYGWERKTGRVRRGFEFAAFATGEQAGAVRYFFMWN
jgi:hypothetical protein